MCIRPFQKATSSPAVSRPLPTSPAIGPSQVVNQAARPRRFCLERQWGRQRELDDVVGKLCHRVYRPLLPHRPSPGLQGGVDGGFLACLSMNWVILRLLLFEPDHRTQGAARNDNAFSFFYAGGQLALQVPANGEIRT